MRGACMRSLVLRTSFNVPVVAHWMSQSCCGSICAGRMWNGATLAAFVYMVEGNSNKSVGIIEGVFGIFCAAAGFPAGKGPLDSQSTLACT